MQKRIKNIESISRAAPATGDTPLGEKSAVEGSPSVPNVNTPETTGSADRGLGQAVTGLSPTDSDPTDIHSTFGTNDFVEVKASPGTRGMVAKILDQNGVGTYEVFVNGKTKVFYGPQLVPAGGDEAAKIATTANEFHAHLTAHAALPPEAGSAVSLSDACLDYIPEQIEAIGSFLRTSNQRYLVATPTGGGKTVLAAMAMRELLSRSEMPNILIICPKPLIVEDKIQNEMKRLGLGFSCPTRREFLRSIHNMHAKSGGNREPSRIIIPYSFLDDKLLHGPDEHGQPGGLLALDPPPLFDLVVVDEAHHIRNPNTCQYQAVECLCLDALAVLYMSASPIQLGDRDLYAILTALGADPGMDRRAFARMIDAVPHLSRATREVLEDGAGWERRTLAHLESASRTEWGQGVLQDNLEFRRTIAILKAGAIDGGERIRVANAIAAVSPFSSVMCSGNTHQIDVGIVRKAATVTVDPTPAQRRFHDDLVRFYTDLMANTYGRSHARFHSTTFLQQAASCINALAPHVKDVLGRRLDKIRKNSGTQDGDKVRKLESEVNRLVRSAEMLGDNDPKLEHLHDIVGQKSNASNPRLLIFAHWRYTLDYLFAQLAKRGVKVGMVHGGVPGHARMDLKRRFQLRANDPTHIQVLLASDVCSEGLDYDFCDTIVNYDLPWNPTVIEQRIGRIDRRGQKNGTVLVYNLVTPGTIDDEIHARCAKRIACFQDIVRTCKPILGLRREELGDIGDEGRLTNTESQSLRRAQADASIAAALLKDDLRHEHFFGLDLPCATGGSALDADLNPWASSEAIENLLQAYLESLIGQGGYAIHGMGMKDLRVPMALKERLRHDLPAAALPQSEAVRRWRHWLCGSEGQLRVAFAANSPMAADAEIMNLDHPLVRQAVAHVAKASSRMVVTIQAFDDEIPPGEYPFEIYRWAYLGFAPRISLVPVCESEIVLPRLASLLLSGVVCTDSERHPGAIPDQRKWNGAHRDLWEEARGRHRCESSALATKLIETLDASHAARSRFLGERCGQKGISDQSRKAYESKLRAITADYERRRNAIFESSENADIDPTSVVSGILRISGPLGAERFALGVEGPCGPTGNSDVVLGRKVA